MPCNCDSLLQLPLSDIGKQLHSYKSIHLTIIFKQNSGTVTDKETLPITRLFFGRTQYSASSGQHTLGRLVCSGQATVDNVPSSCEDLWRTGQTMNGLYLIKGQKSIDTVYCNFTKDPSEPGIAFE